MQIHEALQKYEEAWDDLFAQCCSNPIFNTWGKQVDCTKFNEAHLMAQDALRGEMITTYEKALRTALSNLLANGTDSTVAAAQSILEQKTVTNASKRDVTRLGDMSATGSLRVLLDSENDVVVEVVGSSGRAASVEFCTRQGGGHSRRTRDALLALMAAIEQDNKETPSKDGSMFLGDCGHESD